MSINTSKRSSGSLGKLLLSARTRSGYSIARLAEASKVPGSQIAKLEHDQVQKPNPAQLALLARPLGLSLYQIYDAAGYGIAALPKLGDELEDKLRRLPAPALRQLASYVDELAAEHGIALEPTYEIEA